MIQKYQTKVQEVQAVKYACTPFETTSEELVAVVDAMDSLVGKENRDLVHGSNFTREGCEESLDMNDFFPIYNYYIKLENNNVGVAYNMWLIKDADGNFESLTDEDFHKKYIAIE